MEKIVIRDETYKKMCFLRKRLIWENDDNTQRNMSFSDVIDWLLKKEEEG